MCRAVQNQRGPTRQAAYRHLTGPLGELTRQLVNLTDCEHMLRGDSAKVVAIQVCRCSARSPEKLQLSADAGPAYAGDDGDKVAV